MEGARGLLNRPAADSADPRDPGNDAPGDLRIGEYIDRIAEEIHERVEHQRAVLKSALRDDADKERIGYCSLVDCRRIEALRDAIRETIRVLEETRSAFKSKRLEVLRKRLIEVLAGR